MENHKSTLLVSSTVYGIEELLDRIYTLLTTFGYEVWMSHKGTVPVSSDKTAFENCLTAVENCDCFLGIITTEYGSGIDGSGLSITHQELLKATELQKKRWILTHDHVIFARSFLSKLGYDDREKRKELVLKKSSIFSDLRIIDMYEDAIRDQRPLDERSGNWVQKFDLDKDALLFVTAQFSRYQDAEMFIEENLQIDNPPEDDR